VVSTPDITELGLQVNPSASPLDYPGRMVREDALLAGRWLYRLTGNRTLEVDGGPLRRARDLDAALLELGRPGMADRRAVLAVGSNASPGQLLFKYAGLSREPVVPMFAVTAGGLAVGHSAHVSRAGYVPFVPLARPGHRLAALVLWLDAEQLVVLDRTEPNYRRVMLAGGIEVYRGRWGALRPGPGSAVLAATSQQDVLAALLGLPWFAALARATDPRSASRRLAADPGLRDRVRRALAEHGWAGPDGFQSPPM
jgi:hypothetical protein